VLGGVGAASYISFMRGCACLRLPVWGGSWCWGLWQHVLGAGGSGLGGRVGVVWLYIRGGLDGRGCFVCDMGQRRLASEPLWVFCGR